MNKRSMIGLRLLPFVMASGLVMLAGSGCDREKEFELKFNHLTHVEDYELACEDCHGEARNGRFMPPNHDSCTDCHDDWIDADVAKDTCGNCHIVKDLKQFAEREMPEPEEPVAGVFVHTDALAGLCQDCHGNLFGEKVERAPGLKREDVVRLRDMAHRSGMECLACHVDMDPDVAPADHDQNWTRRHGEWGSQLDNACSVCHSEQSCRECHQEMMPQSHNNLWRLKTHGIEAAWDRERCLVCHEVDSCNACHAEIRPRSHNAAWSKNHCTQCHYNSSAGTGCAFCHEGGLDAHPNPHPAGWNSRHCQNCHNGTPESEQCGLCHEVNSLGSHPNPHSAGWSRRHCGECHNGQLNGVSCGACHGGASFSDHPNPHASNYRNSHCNTCHADSQVVDCGVCHDFSGLADHPNPHAPGYRNSHCNSCHAGSQSQQECGPCHEGAGDILLHQDFWPPVHDRFGDAVDCGTCHF